MSPGLQRRLQRYDSRGMSMALSFMEYAFRRLLLGALCTGAILILGIHVQLGPHLVVDIPWPRVPGHKRTAGPLLLDHAAHLARHLAMLDGDVGVGDLLEDGAVGVDARGPDEEADEGGEDVDAGQGEDIAQPAVADGLVDEVGGDDEGEQEGYEEEDAEGARVPDAEVWDADGAHCWG